MKREKTKSYKIPKFIQLQRLRFIIGSSLAFNELSSIHHRRNLAWHTLVYFASVKICSYNEKRIMFLLKANLVLLHCFVLMNLLVHEVVFEQALFQVPFHIPIIPHFLHRDIHNILRLCHD